MGPRLLRRHRALFRTRRVRELHGRRRPEPRRGQLPREVHAAPGDQKHLRPREPLPPQPKHPARLTTTRPTDRAQPASPTHANAQCAREAETTLVRKGCVMSSASTRLPTPGGPGSVSGAPNLPSGFTDTFASHDVDTGDVRLHAVIGGEGPPLLLIHGWPDRESV